MIPQVYSINYTVLRLNCFRFILWKKLKTPKRHFEINWPLVCCRHYHLTGIFKHLIWHLNHSVPDAHLIFLRCSALQTNALSTLVTAMSFTLIVSHTDGFYKGETRVSGYIFANENFSWWSSIAFLKGNWYFMKLKTASQKFNCDFRKYLASS